MANLTLKAEKRETTGKHVKRVRAAGMVPAVLYGKHAETTLLQIDSKALHTTLAKAGGSTLIALDVAGRDPIMSLAREVQRDNLRHNILHVDFLQVVMTEKITAEIPLVFVGEPPAVANLGGILVHAMSEVQVECLPGDLPATLEIDLSGLVNFNDSVSVEDLRVPAKVTVLAEPGATIARIEAPRLAAEGAEGAEGEEQAPDLAVEPERVTRRKEVEEDE